MGILYAILLAYNSYLAPDQSSQQEVAMVSQQIFRYSPAQGYEMNLYFPEVIGQSLETHRANVGIQYILAKAIADFQRQASAYNQISKLDLNYQLFWNHNGLISIHFSKKILLPQSAPKYIQNTFTYCLKSGKNLKLDDLFSNRNAVVKILKSKLPEHAKFSRQALEYFILDGENIYFCFNNGFLETENCPDKVKVSWSELSGCLNENFSVFSK
jgi:hypothetical protein